MELDLTAALNAYKPQIAERSKQMIRSMFERMTQQFGTNMANVANSRSYSTWNETVRPATRLVTVTPQRGPTPAVYYYEINEEALERIGQRYAEATVASWHAKISEKVGELEQADVRHLDGYRFGIGGMRAGHKVWIEQDMIVNVSPKGKLFNQYPARLYLDGKFISAAAYKRTFAG